MKNLISGLTNLTVASILVVSLASCGGADERKMKYLEKGKSYLAEDNYEKAKIEIKNVLQIDPKFAEAYFLMGQLEEKKKELRKALGNYKKAIELDPEYVEAKIKLSKIYIIASTENYIKKAKKLLSEVKKSDPDNIEAEFARALIVFKVEDKANGIKLLETVVQKDTSQYEAVVLLSMAYKSQGLDAEAKDILIRGAKNNPDNIHIRIALAKMLANMNEFPAAEEHLKAAIALDPERYSLQVALSSIYMASNNIAQAESVLRKAIEDDDEDVQRYIVLVDMLSSRVSVQKAEDELNQAIKNKPEMYELQFVLAKFHLKRGKRDEAKAILEGVAAEKTDDVEGVKARNMLAEILFDDGDKKGAKTYIDKILAEHPNNNDALLIASKLALADSDAITAINSLRTVVKNDPKNTEASVLLAQAHDQNKDNALAENELKRAVEANPINDQTHINYARYLGSKGRMEEMVEVVDKALAYFRDSYGLMELKLKILATQGKENEVIALLNSMEQTDPNNAEVNINRGQLYLAKRNISMALEEFEKAHQKSQDKYKTLQLIVKSHIANKQPEKALDRLQKILDKNPNEAISNLLMGQIYLMQKKVDEARLKFKLASKAIDSWLVPYSSLASSYLNENNYDEAIRVFNEAIPKVKNKMFLQTQIASIYEKQKKYTQAMDIYKKILDEDSGNKVVVNNYASLLLDFGDESDIAKALELSKRFEQAKQVALLDTLAWAYAKSNDNAKAIEILKPIVDKAPNVAVFRYHLGYALLNMGDKSAAKSHLQIAVSSEQQFVGKEAARKLLKTL